jgi:hypothetical protein
MAHPGPSHVVLLQRVKRNLASTTLNNDVGMFFKYDVSEWNEAEWCGGRRISYTCMTDSSLNNDMAAAVIGHR